MNKPSVQYADIEPIIKGSSYKQVFELIYRLSLLRYASKAILNEYRRKVATKSKLQHLVQAGYLNCIANGWFYTGRKGFDTLKREKYNTRILDKELNGNALDHQQALTNYIVGAMKENYFYTVFYPEFTYVKPDCCLVFKNEDKYKIDFVEVEVSKKDKGYIGRKQYKRLGSDKETVLTWWKHWSRKLKIKTDDFCFGVRIV